MNIDSPQQVARIRDLNNLFRRTFIGGRVVMTDGVAALPEETKAQVLTRVREFNEFSADNDPHGENDMGFFEVDGERFMFCISYYEPAMQFHSEDPGDPTKTVRVLTVMRAEEY